MEFAAQSSKGINLDISHLPEEFSPIRSADICSLHELRNIFKFPLLLYDKDIKLKKLLYTCSSRGGGGDMSSRAWILLTCFSLFPRETETDQQNEPDGRNMKKHNGSSPKTPTSEVKPQLGTILDGFWLILSSTYLLFVSLFLWLSAVVSSFFYFQVKNPVSQVTLLPFFLFYFLFLSHSFSTKDDILF